MVRVVVIDSSYGTSLLLLLLLNCSCRVVFYVEFGGLSQLIGTV